MKEEGGKLRWAGACSVTVMLLRAVDDIPGFQPERRKGVLLRDKLGSLARKGTFPAVRGGDAMRVLRLQDARFRYARRLSRPVLEGL